jgi:membrane protein DedA with SNARE-associated domain
MKNTRNTILDFLASLLIVFVFLSVFWYLISEYVDLIKNKQTRTVTLITTIITIILMVLIYNNPEFVKSILK